MTLRLLWPDERYVRVYNRDTLDWLALSWDAQALYVQLCRKATRKGRIDLGRVGRRGVAALVGRPTMWPEPLEGALAELERDGCVRVDGNVLVLEDFVESQEAVSSVKARVRKHREIAEEEAREPDPGNESLQQVGGDVTRGYGTAQHGTEGTVRPRVGGEEPPAREPTGNGAAARLTGDALSQSFAEELEEEASREDKRRGRTLSALGGTWRTVAEVADFLGRKPSTVESDLVHWKQHGVVERQEMPSTSSPSAPPVMHWRRKQAAAEEQPVTLATVVDHVRAHKGDHALFWNPANHRAVCKPHHDARVDEGDFGRRSGT